MIDWGMCALWKIKNTDVLGMQWTYFTKTDNLSLFIIVQHIIVNDIVEKSHIKKKPFCDIKILSDLMTHII
jgi:hypothetical protein